MTLLALARTHCAKHRPALTLDGFARDHYGVSLRAIEMVEKGTRRPTDQFLQRVNATHSRLFPTEPTDIPLADGRTVHLGKGPLQITFP